MAGSVTGVFANQADVDSAVGALRDDGFEPDRIVVISPSGEEIPVAGSAHEHGGLGGWIAEHLGGQGHQEEQHARRLPPQVVEGRFTVTVSPNSAVEESSARNLLVSAGAEAISDAADGHMVPITRPEDGLLHG